MIWRFIISYTPSRCLHLLFLLLSYFIAFNTCSHFVRFVHWFLLFTLLSVTYHYFSLDIGLGCSFPTVYIYSRSNSFVIILIHLFTCFLLLVHIVVSNYLDMISRSNGKVTTPLYNNNTKLCLPSRMHQHIIGQYPQQIQIILKMVKCSQ